VQFFGIANAQWSFDSQFIYLLPSLDDTSFVTTGAALPFGGLTVDEPYGKRKNNDLRFTPGFRVKAATALPNCDGEFAAFYTYLYSKKSRTVVGSHLFATDSFVSALTDFTGYASSKNKLQFQNVDAWYFKPLYNLHCFNLNLITGAEFASIRWHQVHTYVAIDTSEFDKIGRRLRSWGIGPELGLDAEYTVAEFDCTCPSRLNVNFLGTGSLLASKTYNRLRESSSSSPNLKLLDEPTWRVVPALHARVGVSYEMLFSCITTSIEAGYEFNAYFRAFSKQLFFNAVGTGFYNLNIHGLFAGIHFFF